MKFVSRKNKENAAPQPPKPPKEPKAKKEKVRSKRAASGEPQKARGKSQFVLFIGDEGAILVFMRGATVVRRLFAVSPQPDHTGAMVELMVANPKVPVSILADVIDQQYVRHSFPPVSALSVNNLVKRRIERDFQAEDITGSIRLGREKTGRKEWQYLLIALANTPLMQQWIDLIIEQPNELKGIYLSPVEGQHYLTALHAMNTQEKPLPWQLLVSHHKVSGFRQIVLKNGKLVFTRITQAIDDAMPAVIAGNIEQEIMNTLEYLRRLGFLENNSMELMVIAAQEVQEAIDVKRFKTGQAWVMTPLNVAEGLKLEQAALSADRFGDVVMAAAFARTRKRSLKLQTAYGKKLAQLYNARRGIKIFGGLLAVGMLGMSGMNVVKMAGDNSSAEATEDQRRPVQSQLESVRKSIEGLNKDVAFKSAVMLTYDAYLKDTHSIADFIAALAPEMNPQVRVRSINWKEIDPNSPPVAPTGETPPPPPSDGTTKGPTEVKVEFEFSDTYTSTEQLITAANNFIAQIKKSMTGYDIVNLPFPWEGQKDTSVEISFDQPQQQQQMKEGMNKITLIFRGPKPGTAAPAPGGPTP